MKRTFACVLAGLILISATSCNLFIPFAFVVQHKRTVPPEFDKLPGKRVAILVWTDPSTLFDYPYARIELAAYLAAKLEGEMDSRGSQVDVVDVREVEDYLQKSASARINARKLGRKFDADYVVFVEVSRFQFREPDQPQFLRGRIDAGVSVHDVRATADDLQRYELMPAKCLYPEVASVVLTATNAPALRQATYLKFAELVARKFYEYTLDL